MATAFLIGAVAGRWHTGLTFGALGLALAVVVYYGVYNLTGERQGEGPTEALRLWLAVAVAAGPVFGLAGAIWLAGPVALRPWAVALLAGAFAGEALYIATEYGILQKFALSDTPTVFVLLEVGLAGALPFVMLRRPDERVQALTGAVFCALAVFLAIAVVVEGVRDLLSPF